MKLFGIFIIVANLAGSFAIADDWGTYLLYRQTFSNKKSEKHMRFLAAQNSAADIFVTDYHMDDASQCYLSYEGKALWKTRPFYIRNLVGFCRTEGLLEQIQINGKSYLSCRSEEHTVPQDKSRYIDWYAEGVPFWGRIKTVYMNDDGVSEFEQELIEQGHMSHTPPPCSSSQGRKAL